MRNLKIVRKACHSIAMGFKKRDNVGLGQHTLSPISASFVTPNHMEETNAKTTHLGTLTRAPTPIKSEVLKEFLDCYSDRRVADSLMTAFTEGVHINYKRPNVSIYW